MLAAASRQTASAGVLDFKHTLSDNGDQPDAIYWGNLSTRSSEVRLSPHRGSGLSLAELSVTREVVTYGLFSAFVTTYAIFCNKFLVIDKTKPLGILTRSERLIEPGRTCRRGFYPHGVHRTRGVDAARSQSPHRAEP